MMVRFTTSCGTFSVFHKLRSTKIPCFLFGFYSISFENFTETFSTTSNRITSFIWNEHQQQQQQHSFCSAALAMHKMWNGINWTSRIRNQPIRINSRAKLDQLKLNQRLQRAIETREELLIQIIIEQFKLPSKMTSSRGIRINRFCNRFAQFWCSAAIQQRLTFFVIKNANKRIKRNRLRFQVKQTNIGSE